MELIRDRMRDDAGIASAVVLVVVLVAVLTSATLLWRTLSAANDINDKAESIAQTGRGINIATDAVIQLTRTNETAESILATADPLEGQLAEVVELAQSIADLAVSIDGTAGAIDGTANEIDSTAGTIGSTARSINSSADGILAVAGRIDQDVVNINERLDTTIGLARAIKSDTGNILTEAVSIHQSATCIDGKAGGEASGDGHCNDPEA